SLWAFNPFALVSLTIILVLLLTKKKYEYGVIPILLAFNAELAGAINLLFFYITFGFWITLKKEIKWKKYLLIVLGIPALGVSKIVIDFIRTPRDHMASSSAHIGGFNFGPMAIEFIKMIGRAFIPQQAIISFLGVIIIFLFFLFK